MKKFVFIWLLIIAFLITGIAYGQDLGDEDSRMISDVKVMDSQAIENALNGWWKDSMIDHEERIGWWREARLGMFIHWGVYSKPGGEWEGRKVSGYAEHLMRKEKISVNEYVEKLVKPFNPINFNAEEWVLAAKEAGMHYFVITAKHHDGIAMYDSDVSDLNIVIRSEFHRDPMAELAEACKKNGMKFGFYYSHAFDWEHPDAPGNDWDYQNPGGDLNLFGGRNWFDETPELIPRIAKYVSEKSIPQIKELIIKYQPDLLWFDTPHKLPFYENLRILEEIRKVDPNVVVNGRLARTGSMNFGDYLNTSDRPQEFFPVEGNWEAIPTTNESYGYHQYDHSHKPSSFFIQLLAKSASRGGNLLMNIGPKGDGAFDDRDKKILDEIGTWTAKFGESIYGTDKSPLPLQNWGVITQKSNKIYLHVFEWPTDGKLVIGGLQSKPESVTMLLNNGNTLKSKLINQENDVLITIPTDAPDPVNSIIVLQFNKPIKTGNVRLLATGDVQTLLAFDGKLNGSGLGYGDGKADRYYVHNWNKLYQSIEWEFKLTKKARFEVFIKYEADESFGGTFNILSGNQKINSEINTTDKGIVFRKLGELEFSPGTHKIEINADCITGDQLMRLFQIDLKPIKKL